MLETDGNKKSLRIYKRPTIIYVVSSHQILYFDEYEKIDSIYQEFVRNCKEFNIPNSLDEICTMELNIDNEDYKEIYKDKFNLENYINNNIKKLLNMIEKNNH